MSEKILEIEHLSISFDTYAGQVSAVRDVSFAVNKRETLAIVGESGSGKTVTCRSIIKMIAKNATIESGRIIFGDRDILQLSTREIEKIRGNEIAIIFQDPMTSLDPTMKIGKQIMETIRLHKSVSPKAARQRTIELLELVGIEQADKRFHYYPHQFSGGQRQRIVIAIALACDPKLIIADEPTTALDVSMQAQILDLLQKLKENFSTSIIFITHDLGVVSNISDRVAVMYAGKIVEIGTRDEIFEESRHPYTWGLLNSVHANTMKGKPLYTIQGTPPDMIDVPVGDAFAARNPFALNIDFVEEPPLTRISDTHYAATWLLDERAPKVSNPHQRELNHDES